jgi:hypothetical protein
MKYYVVAIVSSLITWQLMWFFLFDEGRIQKWRLRKAIDNIRDYIEEHGLHTEFKVNYKNRTFAIGIIEEEVNRIYKFYDIFINGEAVARYHCLQHDFLNSYYFEKTSVRHTKEVIEILHAGNKVLKRQKRHDKQKVTDSYKANSYFSKLG